jgi:hypothetical protein
VPASTFEIPRRLGVQSLRAFAVTGQLVAVIDAGGESEIQGMRPIQVLVYDFVVGNLPWLERVGALKCV